MFFDNFFLHFIGLLAFTTYPPYVRQLLWNTTLDHLILEASIPTFILSRSEAWYILLASCFVDFKSEFSGLYFFAKPLSPNGGMSTRTICHIMNDQHLHVRDCKYDEVIIVLLIFTCPTTYSLSSSFCYLLLSLLSLSLLSPISDGFSVDILIRLPRTRH